MKIAGQTPINTTSFKAGQFAGVTAELDKNIVLSRAIIDMFGCDIPWVVMANNKQERIERTIRYSIVFTLAFLSPMAVLPLFNRVAMKNFAKLTDKFFTNNHKAIHLSNEFLVNKEKMLEGLNTLAQKTSASPIELLAAKLTRKPVKPQVLDIQDLIKRAGGTEELRQKLIKTKNGVLFTDLITSGVSLGSVNFINNHITEKRSGQKGFSAEFNMAEKNIVEKRAGSYDKSKWLRYSGFMALTLAISTAIPLSLRKGLSSVKPAKLPDFIKKYSKLADYRKGIYMSRFALMMCSVMCHGGAIIFARNKTEAKDIAVRFGTADAIFYGGDLLLLAMFTRISDTLFGTKLLKEIQNKKSLLRKIFPENKSVKEILEEVDAGKLAKKNKYAAIGMFWLNIVLLSIAMGFGISAMMNKVIKKDVQKDVDKANLQTPPSSFAQHKNKTFEKFII